jgi:hypothetical protein
MNAHVLHILWLFINGVLLLLRFISVTFMIKGLLYLMKRTEERERKVQRQILKAKRFRERKRNELERKIAK